jgi:hypothetical protein
MRRATGGCNAARIPKEAQWTDFQLGGADALEITCPLQVLIKHVVLGNDLGYHTVLSDTGGTIPACIDPLQNAFTFTKAMYANWESLTQHKGNAPGDGSPGYTAQTFPLSADPLIGDLTITLRMDTRP